MCVTAMYENEYQMLHFKTRHEINLSLQSHILWFQVCIVPMNLSTLLACLAA